MLNGIEIHLTQKVLSLNALQENQQRCKLKQKKRKEEENKTKKRMKRATPIRRKRALACAPTHTRPVNNLYCSPFL